MPILQYQFHALYTDFLTHYNQNTNKSFSGHKSPCSCPSSNDRLCSFRSLLRLPQRPAPQPYVFQQFIPLLRELFIEVVQRF